MTSNPQWWDDIVAAFDKRKEKIKSSDNPRSIEHKLKVAAAGKTEDIEWDGQLTWDMQSLSFNAAKVGTEPKDGFPLYIALHGGERTTASKKNAVWELMKSYYRGSLDSASGKPNYIYVTPRGIGDAADMHFTSAGYVLIERLIENMIIFENADPNRVFLLGFSVGGDGVYRLATRLAQRFAAANMSAGNRGDVSLINLANVPICLQAGELDAPPYFGADHSISMVKAAIELDILQSSSQHEVDNTNVGETLYQHQTFLHAWRDPPDEADSLTVAYWPHDGWESENILKQHPRPLRPIIKDYTSWLAKVSAQRGKPNRVVPVVQSREERTNTNAVDFVNQFSRNRQPPHYLAWDLSNQGNDNFTRDVQSTLSGGSQFYWLDITGYSPTEVGPVIKARWEKSDKKNAVIVSSAKKYLRILLRPDMLDLTKPISISVNGFALTEPIGPLGTTPNPAVVADTLVRNDPNLVYTANIFLTEADDHTWTAHTQPPPPPMIKAVL